MAQNLKETLESDKQTFEHYIQEISKRKIKMINPNVSAKVSASAGVIAYINSLIERLEKGEITDL